jgi:hypothetical protein
MGFNVIIIKYGRDIFLVAFVVKKEFNLLKNIN